VRAPVAQCTRCRRPLARDRRPHASATVDQRARACLRSTATRRGWARASPLEPSPADERASEGQQRAVQAGVAFPADAEPAEVVQPGKRPLDHPPHAPESRAVLGGAPRDRRLDAAAPQFAAILIVVVAAIGKSPGWGAGEAGRACLRSDRSHRRAAGVVSRRCDFRRSARRPAACREGRR
jgi:hypothetical protein